VPGEGFEVKRKPTRKQKHALLVEAKKHLARDRSELPFFSRTQYICWAIDLAVWDHGTYLVGLALKDLIRGRLNNTLCLEPWLKIHHGIHVRHYTNVEYRNKMQATRHAWIDSLIEEFS